MNATAGAPDTPQSGRKLSAPRRTGDGRRPRAVAGLLIQTSGMAALELLTNGTRFRIDVDPQQSRGLRRNAHRRKRRRARHAAGVSAFECGAVVNPDQLRNQSEGALMMGIGGALFESVAFQEGRILSNRLSRYRVPRFGDMPRIEVVILDRKDIPSAGAGKTPIAGVAPAVAGAIFGATGLRIRALPLVPRGLEPDRV